MPVPAIVAPPGEAVTVQDPEPGRSLKAILPVETEQVGWVIVPTVGTPGVPG